MKKLIPLLIIVLMVSGLYFGLKGSGMLQEFDDAIHERNGWKRTATSRYEKFETFNKTFVHYTVLNDPEFTGVRVLEGAIKKEAVDRMTFKTSSAIEITGLNKDDVKDHLKLIAKSVGCNTVIIDGRSNIITTSIQSFGL